MKAQGFSLLELLLAMALGGVLTAGLLTIYLSVKINHSTQQALADLQESGRFAVYILSQRIRLAGFAACANSENPVNQDQAVVGYDSAHLPAFLQHQVVQETDAVVINSCVANSSFSKNTELKKIAYFIGDTNRKNSEGQTILALFQKPSDDDREELIAGVEQMQLLYGVAASSDADSVVYYAAAQVGDWEKVRSVQIALLLNSVEPVLSKPKSTSSDRLLHKPWNIYVTLRERIHGF